MDRAAVSPSRAGQMETTRQSHTHTRPEKWEWVEVLETHLYLSKEKTTEEKWRKCSEEVLLTGKMSAPLLTLTALHCASECEVSKN